MPWNSIMMDVSFLGYMEQLMNHPDLEYRIAYRLGLLSFALGLIALGLGILSVVRIVVS